LSARALLIDGLNPRWNPQRISSTRPSVRTTDTGIGFADQGGGQLRRLLAHPDRAEAERFYNFPYETLEEALANAVYHRGYSKLFPGL
jgi:hypothetical protein